MTGWLLVPSSVGRADAQGAGGIGSLQQAGQVLIHEIMYHPMDGQPEYLELHNPGPADVDLGGLAFSRGIDLVFPAGSRIPAGGYGLVCADLEACRSAYPAQAERLLAQYAGRLDNAGERLTLSRPDPGDPAAEGELFDTLRYNDRGLWPREADGDGRSLELIHPGLDNSLPQAWRASAPGGSPGQANSRYEPEPAPIVAEVQHDPALPAAGQPIWVSARIVGHAADALGEVWLDWRPDAAQPGDYASLPMRDDGQGGDAASGDGIFGAALPGQAGGDILDFRLRAESRRAGVEPGRAPQDSSRAFYAVFGSYPEHSAEYPSFHIVLPERQRAALHARANLFSEVLRDATLITGEGETFYNAGVRLRGQGSRFLPGARNYRLELPPGRDIEGRDRFNLNARNPLLQWLGMDAFSRMGLPTPALRFTRLWMNGQLMNRVETGGFYVELEPPGPAMIERFAPDLPVGRLYRTGYRDLPGGGIDGDGPTGDLSWRGSDQARYKDQGYYKVTREEEDDWQDIVDLCDVLNNTAAAEYPEGLTEHVDIQAFIDFFALHAALGNGENGIYLRSGDDYMIYTADDPPITWLLPWDMDSILLLEAAEREHSIWWTEVPAPRRFLRHPEIAPRYVARILELWDSVLAPEAMAERLDAIGSSLRPADRRALEAALTRRERFVRAEINLDLTVEVDGRTVRDDPIEVSRTRVRLSGKAPQAGTLRVLVAGEAVNWQPVLGQWETFLDLAPGRNEIEVRAEGIGAPTVRRIVVFTPGPDDGGRRVFLPWLGRVR